MNTLLSSQSQLDLRFMPARRRVEDESDVVDDVRDVEGPAETDGVD